ncbi:MAG: DNA-3-methyladenine glycosylase [Vulcanimicrobiaceae bacterium]
MRVRTPYRLDLTADALRRLGGNVVDRFDGECYMCVLADDDGSSVVRVRQTGQETLSIQADGKNAARFVPVVERMLGTSVDLSEWYRRSAGIPWLEALARDLCGVTPSRYPGLWEALCHAIVFQQISIHAAGAIMQRMIEAIGTPRETGSGAAYPFPAPVRILESSDEQLRAAGLSVNKITALRSVAQAVVKGDITEAELDALETPQAVARLAQLRGIGPWSAMVVLLRGLGRLEAFPLKDSGVAASLRLLSGNPQIDAAALLERLGTQRGMLYFHLLLGRLARGRPAAATRSGL